MKKIEILVVVSSTSVIPIPRMTFGSVLSQISASYRGTPTKVKVMDLYLVYVMLTGAIQFAYMLLVGTFPFNSFLSGFISTLGCFVLTGTLQTFLFSHFSKLNKSFTKKVGVDLFNLASNLYTNHSYKFNVFYCSKLLKTQKIKSKTC